MAFHLPDSEFVGIDLAQTPIDAGHVRIKRLGLANIQLHQGDVAGINAGLGQFDYVIAHGLYSWVPEAVRPHILRVASELLTANGVAYVSYNALPGCRLRHLVRELLQFRFGASAYEPQRINEVRSFLREFARVENSNDDGFMKILKAEIGFVTDIPDYVLFHDDLTRHSSAFYLHEFVSAANSVDLQYLGEANLSEMFTMTGFDEFDSVLDRWANSDWVAREQYQDFTKGRRFRQSLLCRQSIALNREVDESTIRNHNLRSSLQAKSPEQSLLAHEPLEFVQSHRTVQIDQPVAKISLSLLAKAYPDTVSFAEVFSAALAECQSAGIDYHADSTATALSKLFWSLARAGLLEVHGQPVRLLQHVGDKPRLNDLILDSLKLGIPLVGALHTGIKLEDQPAQLVCQKMDGRHDRLALCAALQVAPQDNEASLSKIASLCEFLRRMGAFANP